MIPETGTRAEFKHMVLEAVTRYPKEGDVYVMKLWLGSEFIEKEVILRGFDGPWLREGYVYLAYLVSVNEAVKFYNGFSMARNRFFELEASGGFTRKAA